MEEIVVLNGARTGFGSFGGSLAGFSSIDLGTMAATEAIKRAGIEPADVNEIIFGNVIQSEPNAIYLARHIGLRANLGKHVPALTVNRLCGSGLEALVSGARVLLTSDANVIVTGGTESMSNAPYATWKARWGAKMGPISLEDTLTSGLTDNLTNTPMGITAENLAERYKISRQEQDEFATESQTRAEDATKSGKLGEEIFNVEIKDRKGMVTNFQTDEYIKGAEGTKKLSSLRPAFKKDGGTVTAGNASGINDGASAIVLAKKSWADAKGLAYLATVGGMASVGCEPTEMGIGPAVAIPAALKQSKISLADVDLFEVNEAFAAQYLAVEKELKLDRAKTNVNGGAIAIGHPLGASGSRVALTSIYELKRRGLKTAVASLCIGGGQGIAVVFSRN